MKGIKSFNTKNAIASAVAVFGAGAGSAVADWLLAKYNVLPENWEQTTVNAGKLVAGAVAGSMVKNSIVKSFADGIATVAAAKLVEGMLPENETTTTTETPAGLPQGTIGRIRRMGNKAFRKRVAGVAGSDFMSC